MFKNNQILYMRFQCTDVYGCPKFLAMNRLRNTIFSACQRASLPARLKAGCGLGSIELRTRPADILVSSWEVKDTAAFDITVTSPLSPKIVSEAGGSAGVAAKAAESRKHEQNDTKCSELGWQCIPLAVETYGAWGEEACNAFSCIAMREAILTNSKLWGICMAD